MSSVVVANVILCFFFFSKSYPENKGKTIIIMTTTTTETTDTRLTLDKHTDNGFILQNIYLTRIIIFPNFILR